MLWWLTWLCAVRCKSSGISNASSPPTIRETNGLENPQDGTKCTTANTKQFSAWQDLQYYKMKHQVAGELSQVHQCNTLLVKEMINTKCCSSTIGKNTTNGHRSWPITSLCLLDHTANTSFLFPVYLFVLFFGLPDSPTSLHPSCFLLPLQGDLQMFPRKHLPQTLPAVPVAVHAHGTFSESHTALDHPTFEAIPAKNTRMEVSVISDSWQGVYNTCIYICIYLCI